MAQMLDGRKMSCKTCSAKLTRRSVFCQRCGTWVACDETELYNEVDPRRGQIASCGFLLGMVLLSLNAAWSQYGPPRGPSFDVIRNLLMYAFVIASGIILIKLGNFMLQRFAGAANTVAIEAAKRIWFGTAVATIVWEIFSKLGSSYQ